MNKFIFNYDSYGVGILWAARIWSTVSTFWLTFNGQYDLARYYLIFTILWWGIKYKGA